MDALHPVLPVIVIKAFGVMVLGCLLDSGCDVVGAVIGEQSLVAAIVVDAG